MDCKITHPKQTFNNFISQPFSSGIVLYHCEYLSYTKSQLRGTLFEISQYVEEYEFKLTDRFRCYKSCRINKMNRQKHFDKMLSKCMCACVFVYNLHPYWKSFRAVSIAVDITRSYRLTTLFTKLLIRSWRITVLLIGIEFIFDYKDLRRYFRISYPFPEKSITLKV